MELKDRMRYLRKQVLKMSMSAFGEKLGVSRDVINNIENDRLARPDQKLSLIKLICKEFSVNEEWLLNGTEPMFVEPETFSLDQFVKDRGMSDLEFGIIKTYLELDPEIRHKALEYFKTHLCDNERSRTQESNDNSNDDGKS